MGRLASLPVGAFVMAFRASAVVRLAARVPGRAKRELSFGNRKG